MINSMLNELRLDKDPTRDAYLGDGVYVTHDGYQVWLVVSREPGHCDYIAIDENVFSRLCDYASCMLDWPGRPDAKRNQILK